MKTLKLAALFVSIALGTQAGANLLDDGHFDLSTDGTQTSNSAWELITNFTSGGESAQFMHNSAAGTDPAGTIEGVWFKSFLGTLDDGQPFAEATLRQELVGVAAGDYTLTFDAKREVFFSAGTWSVTLDSNESGTDSINLLIAAPNDGSWNAYQLTLFGVAEGSTLVVTAQMLTGESALGGNPQSAFVDNFVLVPEPTSLALLGLGGLIVARRRR